MDKIKLQITKTGLPYYDDGKMVRIPREHFYRLYPEESISKRCFTCREAKKSVKVRIDNGLPSGIHCDECWNRLISECKRRSW